MINYDIYINFFMIMVNYKKVVKKNKMKNYNEIVQNKSSF